ncbi:D Chain D, consensus ankyrin repeat [Paramuricea clavata]|uniref:D Chain D, consensus ankyrin repeat n=1 Tax=Paramuricea clavata TaxID=317549 RepID=A0A6S7GCQ6_PARCT|nr:D Chain D, consensus ankyrin repeat [Paramuricea clavata]
MKQVSKNAKDVMKRLKNDILSFTKKKDRVLHLQSNNGLWVDLTDDNGCSSLHLAVEDKCVCLVESLILAGSNVNVSEGCGITPVMIAVNNNQPDIVKILVKYGARTTGTFQGNIPSPLQIAMQIRNHEIDNTNSGKSVIIRNECDENSARGTWLVERTVVFGAVNRLGDVKSASTLRGVRNRAPDEFGSFKEVPGDFHTQAYVMECLSRISGPRGFFYTIRQVLGRLKVTPKSFVDIFKEGNYERNMDALNDYFWGLCFAAVISFVSSDLFPDNETLSEIQSRCGNVNDVLLEKLKCT